MIENAVYVVTGVELRQTAAWPPLHPAAEDGTLLAEFEAMRRRLGHGNRPVAV